MKRTHHKWEFMHLYVDIATYTWKSINVYKDYLWEKDKKPGEKRQKTSKEISERGNKNGDET